MTNKAWFALVAAGLLGSLAMMGGCVVGGDDDDDTGGSGGITSGGGSGGSGNSTSGGGSGNTTSGGGTAGTSGGGGSGGSVISCDPTGSTPGSCTADPVNSCTTCLEQKCCTEYAACIATDPDDSCGWGGPDPVNAPGEIFCIQECLFGVQADGGVADDTTIAECTGACQTAGCGTISPQTSDLVACIKDQCFAECFQQ